MELVQGAGPGAGVWEPQIKIEYYESVERDPLARRIRPEPFRPPPPLQPPPPPHGVCLSAAATALLCINTDIDSHSSAMKHSGHQEESWYRGINDSGKMVCKFCELTYSTTQTLRFHIKNKHQTEMRSLKTIKKYGSPKLFCHLCKERFKTLEILKCHVHQHKIFDMSFTCDYCNIVFESKNRVKDHIFAKHADSDGNFFKRIKAKVMLQKELKKFPCPHCKHVAKRNYGLTIHIKARHKTEEDLCFLCPFCSYKSSIKYYLQNHIVSNHPQSDFAATKTIHCCDVCGYRTPKKSHYLMHRKTHLSSVKAHECGECDYTTNVLGNLDVHRRTHTNHKPYFCDFDKCDYRSGTRSALTSHRLKHFPDENRLYCDKCNYSTVYKSSLRKHTDSHYRNRAKCMVISQGANR